MVQPEVLKHILKCAKIRKIICSERGLDANALVNKEDLIAQTIEETELYDVIDSLDYVELADFGSIILIGQNDKFKKYEDYDDAKSYVLKNQETIVDDLYLLISLDDYIEKGMKILKRENI